MFVFHLLFQAAEKLENDIKLLINKSIPYTLQKTRKKQTHQSKLFRHYKNVCRKRNFLIEIIQVTI